MIVLLSGRSMFCHGLTVQLGLMNRPVAAVPLSSSIALIATTLRQLQPQLLIVDALDVRTAGFLFLDALRQDTMLAACPVLIIASGTFPDEQRFAHAARQRGHHILLEPATFEELVEHVNRLASAAPPPLSALAS